MGTRAVFHTAVLVAMIPSMARAQRACESLTALTLTRATVTSAEVVPAGTYRAPGGFPPRPMTLPSYCRVVAVARPTDDSEIGFEVWLPIGAEWNGKYQQAGNGGFAGGIPVGQIAGGVSQGYATAGTDDGHTVRDASFAPGHPEKVVDFGHRAVHQTAVQSKAIIAAFYGKEPSQSYFFGCSDGGREALMEAQRYPTDFKGIVAGAPANNWTHLLTAAIWNWRAQNETPGSAIPAGKLSVIQAGVVAACDQLDGVNDGLIEDPRRCRFRPSTLKCAGDDRPDCLTSDQIAALEKIYRGPRSPRTGKSIFPGMAPGTEALVGGWNAWVVRTSPTNLPLQAWFGTGFFANMVFEDPKWDYRTMDFDRDLAAAVRKTGGALDSNDPDLRPFRDRGGKLIQYHGWGDAAIAPASSIEYYERVKAALGKSKDKPVEDFYRLFMVPGMGHCAGGIGANDFGNFQAAEPAQADPDHDVLAALARWVEHGVAPERFIAAGTRPGDAITPPPAPVKLTRPLCPYPKTAHYRGSGSSDDAASFSCSPGTLRPR